jgi:hypothetical protein
MARVKGARNAKGRRDLEEFKAFKKGNSPVEILGAVLRSVKDC